MAVDVGDIVRAHYNSGVYIGELIEDRGDRFLVKVLAVKKHPMQGDLHHPKQIDVGFFHERKALAHYEKMNVKKEVVFPHNGEIPDYHDSLMTALEEMKENLAKKDTAFNRQSLKQLNDFEEKYYHKSYYK